MDFLANEWSDLREAAQYKIAYRGAGGVAQSHADQVWAGQSRGWRAKLTLADTCADAWRWQSNNPNGYK